MGTGVAVGSGVGVAVGTGVGVAVAVGVASAEVVTSSLVVGTTYPEDALLFAFLRSHKTANVKMPKIPTRAMALTTMVPAILFGTRPVGAEDMRSSDSSIKGIPYAATFGSSSVSYLNDPLFCSALNVSNSSAWDSW